MMDAPDLPSTPQYPYLQGLNPKQYEAITTTQGPVLVLAGAGTGKTRVLTTRLAHLLETGEAYPSQILAVTFTNKAAQEMKDRVSHLLNGMPIEGWWLGTFHALAARMLRRNADHVGLSSNFTILDPDDQIRLVKQVMEIHGLDPKKHPPKAIIAIIDRWKDRAILPDAVPKSEAADVADGKAITLYHDYQRRLKEMNACDFGDLLLHMITLFKSPDHPEILQDYHRRFRYIMVDEYQDTNSAQYLWLRLLAQGSQNICCVGDDDQSIYGWRGAEVENILRFDTDFAGAKLIRLEQNYRSTNHILKAAGGIIAHNGNRLGKDLWSESGDGAPITVMGFWDGDAEARWIGEEIENLQHKKQPLSDIAILVRAGFQTREFEERFIKLGIAYQVIGGQRFYERAEIRDALAYLRATVQPHDDLALERIINKPKRAIGNQSIQKLYAHARQHGISLYDSIRDLTQTSELPKRLRTALMRLMDDFERWRSLMDQMEHADLTAQILEDSGYMAMWKTNKAPDAPGRVENLKELISGMKDFQTMDDFLEHVALVFENQSNADQACVTLMTLHGAKGLEFNTVFLPGWEEGLFPSQRTLDENGVKGLEEERRLAYVGITRARKKAYISHVGNRRMYGSFVASIPSRFIEELPPETIDRETAAGLPPQGRSHHWDSSGFTQQPRTIKHTPAVTQHSRNTSGTVFTRGDTVQHAKFGSGTIINIEGHKLDIQFATNDIKRVLDSFVTKAK